MNNSNITPTCVNNATVKRWLAKYSSQSDVRPAQLTLLTRVINSLREHRGSFHPANTPWLLSLLIHNWPESEINHLMP